MTPATPALMPLTLATMSCLNNHGGCRIWVLASKTEYFEPHERADMLFDGTFVP